MMSRPTRQQTIGILGGMSDKATAEYYRLINGLVNQRLGGWETAELLIASVNFGNIEQFIRNEDWPAIEHYLTDKVGSLKRGGADFVICVSNTVHRVLENIFAEFELPYIHIVDPTAAAIAGLQMNRVGLLGTRPVMSSSYISARYSENFGIETIVPEHDDQQVIHQIIFDELVKGVVRPESKRIYVDICRRLQDRGAQGIILGCTEIFLLLEPADLPGLPLFNTTYLHAQAAVDRALG